MKLLDLFIIYFACGSPFGVYQVTTITGGLTLRAATGVLLRVCLWPIFTAVILANWFTGHQAVIESGLDRHIKSIRTQMEGLAFASGTVSSVFDFREIVYLYTGLSEAANLPQTSSGTNELFDLSTNENKKLATICLARKNQRRLFIHHAQARAQFVDMVSELASTDLDGTFLRLAIELAHCVKDSTAVDALTALIAKEISAQPDQAAIKSRSAPSPV